GTKGTNGYWGLYLNSAGTGIYFATQTNSSGSSLLTNLSAAISWTDYGWHQIALTYTSTNSSLYIDGQIITNNGSGVSAYPSFSVRSLGFRLGSDSGGTNQAHGAFENLETFNYPLNASSISNGYSAPCWAALDVVLVMDISGSMTNLLTSGGISRLDAAK